MKNILSFLVFVFLQNVIGASLFDWDEYIPPPLANQTEKSIRLLGLSSKTVVPEAVYVSITTISSRIHKVHNTIWSILSGTIIPDRVFLFVSKSSYLIDSGISRNDITPDLLHLVRHYPVSIIFTNNIGPHRKLLPLLYRMWRTDCVIITFDDEPLYWLKNHVLQLLNYYVASKRKSVVSLKARRFAFCSQEPHKVISYGSWGEACFGMTEFFLLPVGVGGVLYHPRFFDPIIFDEEFINMTRTTDDLAFRLATMSNGVFVTTGCRQVSHRTEADIRHGSTLLRNCPAKAEVVFHSSKAFQDSSLEIMDEKWRRRISEPNNERGTGRSLVGLLDTFNKKKGGNDDSFYNSRVFLKDRRVFVFEDVASLLLPFERGECLNSGNKVLTPFPGGKMSCMMSQCRNPRYSAESIGGVNNSSALL